jgi:hypothetical protein
VSDLLDRWLDGDTSPEPELDLMPEDDDPEMRQLWRNMDKIRARKSECSVEELKRRGQSIAQPPRREKP